jgi:hypothetical protein
MLFPSPNRWTSNLIGRRGSVPPEHPRQIDTKHADAIVRHDRRLPIDSSLARKYLSDTRHPASWRLLPLLKTCITNTARDCRSGRMGAG